jgi:hypothetical protein
VSIAEGLLAYANGGQTAPTAVATQVTAYNTPVRNDFGTGAFSGGTFTVPAGKSGWYTISGTYINANVAAGSINQVYISVNGSAVTQAINSPVGMGNQVWPSVTLSKYLSVGDTVALNVVQTSGGGTSISSATNFSLVRLGSTPGQAAPAFSAYKSANQTLIGGGGLTQVTFDSEVFDTASNFDTATGRFTPTIAGKYILTSTNFVSTGGPTCSVANGTVFYIRKNGVIIATSGANWGNGSYASGDSLSVVADANGTTDYFDIQYINSCVSNLTLAGSAGATTFTGSLVSGAVIGGGSGSITNSLSYSTSTGILTSTVSSTTATTSLLGFNQGPAFSAGITAVQAIPSGVNTVVVTNTETFDTHNNHNTATGRFTPTVAGKYILTFTDNLGAMTQAPHYVSIRKNGTIIAQTYDVLTSTPAQNFQGLTVTAIVDANGTTDYFDAVVTQSSGVAVNENPGLVFSGSYLGGNDRD